MKEISNLQTYTPTITGSGSNPTISSYAAQNGTYAMIGNRIVYLQVNVIVNQGNWSGGSGIFGVTLPSNLPSGSIPVNTYIPSIFNAAKSSVYFFSNIVEVSGTSLRVRSTASNLVGNQLQFTTDFDNTGYISLYFSGVILFT